MAKNDKDPALMDEVEFDDDLFSDLDSESSDLEGFDISGENINTEENRKPASKSSAYTDILKTAGGAAVGGAAIGIASKLKSSMPNVGIAANSAINVASDFKRMKDDVVKDIGPMVTQFKTTSRQILPFAKDLLPESIFNKVSKALEPKQEEGPKGPSLEEQRNQHLEDSLNAIFGAQDAQHQVERRDDLIRKTIDDRIAGSRHREMVGVSSDIRNQSMFQTQFIRTTLTAYLRKDLEIKYRRLYLAEDTLESLRITSQMLEEKLDQIRHNTALPEYDKINLSELAMQKITSAVGDKFIGGFGGQVQRYMKGVRDRIYENWIEPAKDMAGGLNDALAGVADILSMQADEAEFTGQKYDARKTAAGWVGKGIGSLLGAIGGRKLVKKLPESFKTTLDNMAANSGLATIELIERIKNGDVSFWGSNFLSNILDSVTPEIDKSAGQFENITYQALDKPGTITNRFVTAVEQIIPGYLAKQTQYLAMLAGDQRGAKEELVWDYRKMQLVGGSALRERILTEARGTQQDRAYTLQGINVMIGKVATARNRKNQLVTYEKVARDAALALNNIANAKILFNKGVVDAIKDYLNDGTEKSEDPIIQTLLRGTKSPRDTAQAIFDMVADARQTEDGIQYTYDYGAISTIAKHLGQLSKSNADRARGPIFEAIMKENAQNVLHGVIDADDKGNYVMNQESYDSAYDDITAEMINTAEGGDYDYFGIKKADSTALGRTVKSIQETDWKKKAIDAAKGVDKALMSAAEAVGLDDVYGDIRNWAIDTIDKFAEKLHKIGKGFREWKAGIKRMAIAKVYQYLVHDSSSADAEAIGKLLFTVQGKLRRNVDWKLLAAIISRRINVYWMLNAIVRNEKNNAVFWLIQQIMPQTLKDAVNMSVDDILKGRAAAIEEGTAREAQSLAAMDRLRTKLAARRGAKKDYDLESLVSDRDKATDYRDELDKYYDEGVEELDSTEAMRFARRSARAERFLHGTIRNSTPNVFAGYESKADKKRKEKEEKERKKQEAKEDKEWAKLSEEDRAAKVAEREAKRLEREAKELARQQQIDKKVAERDKHLDKLKQQVYTDRYGFAQHYQLTPKQAEKQRKRFRDNLEAINKGEKPTIEIDRQNDGLDEDMALIRAMSAPRNDKFSREADNFKRAYKSRIEQERPDWYWFETDRLKKAEAEYKKAVKNLEDSLRNYGATGQGDDYYQARAQFDHAQKEYNEALQQARELYDGQKQAEAADAALRKAQRMRAEQANYVKMKHAFGYVQNSNGDWVRVADLADSELGDSLDELLEVNPNAEWGRHAGFIAKHRAGAEYADKQAAEKQAQMATLVQRNKEGYIDDYDRGWIRATSLKPNEFERYKSQLARVPDQFLTEEQLRFLNRVVPANTQPVAPTAEERVAQVINQTAANTTAVEATAQATKSINVRQRQLLNAINRRRGSYRQMATGGTITDDGTMLGTHFNQSLNGNPIGSVSRPTLIHGGRALVGEAGPETIVPLNHTDAAYKAYLQAKAFHEGRAYAEGATVDSGGDNVEDQVNEALNAQKGSASDRIGGLKSAFQSIIHRGVAATLKDAIRTKASGMLGSIYSNVRGRYRTFMDNLDGTAEPVVEPTPEVKLPLIPQAQQKYNEWIEKGGPKIKTMATTNKRYPEIAEWARQILWFFDKDVSKTRAEKRLNVLTHEGTLKDLLTAALQNDVGTAESMIRGTSEKLGEAVGKADAKKEQKEEAIKAAKAAGDPIKGARAAAEAMKANKVVEETEKKDKEATKAEQTDPTKPLPEDIAEMLSAVTDSRMCRMKSGGLQYFKYRYHKLYEMALSAVVLGGATNENGNEVITHLLQTGMIPRLIRAYFNDDRDALGELVHSADRWKPDLTDGGKRNKQSKTEGKAEQEAKSVEEKVKEIKEQDAKAKDEAVDEAVVKANKPRRKGLGESIRGLWDKRKERNAKAKAAEEDKKKKTSDQKVDTEADDKAAEKIRKEADKAMSAATEEAVKNAAKANAAAAAGKDFRYDFEKGVFSRFKLDVSKMSVKDILAQSLKVQMKSLETLIGGITIKADGTSLGLVSGDWWTKIKQGAGDLAKAAGRGLKHVFWDAPAWALKKVGTGLGYGWDAIKGAAGWGADLGRSIGSGLRDFFSKHLGQGKFKTGIKKVGSALGSFITSPFRILTGTFKKYVDVYWAKDPNTPKQPLVTAAELEAGLVVGPDGKPPKDSYHIKTPLWWIDNDANGEKRGNIAITAEQIRDGLVDAKGKPLNRLSYLLGAGIRGAAGLAGKGLGMIFGGGSGIIGAIGGWAMRTTVKVATAAWHKLTEKKDPYINVYVPDKDGVIDIKKPRLTGENIKLGRYRYANGHIVTSAYGIRGAVYDQDLKNTLITEEEVQHGLYDASGKKLTSWAGRSLLGKATIGLAGLGLKGIVKAGKGIWKGLKGIKGGIGDAIKKILSGGASAWEGLQKFYFSTIDRIMMNHGATRQDLEDVVGQRLIKIYDLLDARLPGGKDWAERKKQAEEQAKKEAEAKKDAEEAKEKKEEAEKRKAEMAAQNAAKKDADGDGDRDGSYQDYKQKMEAKKKEKEAEQGATAQTGASKDKKSALAAILAALKGGGKDEGEEEGGGIGLSDILDAKDAWDWFKSTKWGRSVTKWGGRVWTGTKGMLGGAWNKFRGLFGGGKGASTAGRGAASNAARGAATNAARTAAGQAARGLGRFGMQVGIRALATPMGLAIAAGTVAIGGAAYGIYKLASDSDTVTSFKKDRYTAYGIDPENDDQTDAIEDLEELALEVLDGERKELTHDEVVDIAMKLGLISADGYFGSGASTKYIKDRIPFFNAWFVKRFMPIFGLYTQQVRQYSGADQGDEPDPDDIPEELLDKCRGELKTYYSRVVAVDGVSDLVPTKEGYQKALNKKNKGKRSNADKAREIAGKGAAFDKAQAEAIDAAHSTATAAAAASGATLDKFKRDETKDERTKRLAEVVNYRGTKESDISVNISEITKAKANNSFINDLMASTVSLGIPFGESIFNWIVGDSGKITFKDKCLHLRMKAYGVDPTNEDLVDAVLDLEKDYINLFDEGEADIKNRYLQLRLYHIARATEFITPGMLDGNQTPESKLELETRREYMDVWYATRFCKVFDVFLGVIRDNTDQAKGDSLDVDEVPEELHESLLKALTNMFRTAVSSVKISILIPTKEGYRKFLLAKELASDKVAAHKARLEAAKQGSVVDKAAETYASETERETNAQEAMDALRNRNASRDPSLQQQIDNAISGETIRRQEEAKKRANAARLEQQAAAKRHQQINNITKANLSTFEEDTSGIAKSDGYVSSVKASVPANISKLNLGTTTYGAGTATITTNGAVAVAPQIDVAALEAAPIPDGGMGDLGAYVKQFESGSLGSKVIGWDSTGGTSYGMYQIASKPGTFAQFLEYAKTTGGEFGRKVASIMSSCGKLDTGSRRGAGPDAWKRLAEVNGGKSLHALEAGFIRKTHYEVALRGIANPEARALIEQDRGLREALWSTSVQHGPGADKGAAAIFNRTYKPGMSAAEWLVAIYQKRGTQFGSSTPQVRRSVLNRFKKELPIVLGLSKTSAVAASTSPSLNAVGGSSGTTTSGGVPSSAGSYAYSTSTSGYAGGGSGVDFSEVKDIPYTGNVDISALTLQKGVDYGNLSPLLQERFANMAKAYQAKFGKKIIVTSGKRSMEEQAELRRKKGSNAAIPNPLAPHISGLALDANSPDMEAAERSGLLAEYGLYRPLKNGLGRTKPEPWHVELMGSRDPETKRITEETLARLNAQVNFNAGEAPKPGDPAAMDTSADGVDAVSVADQNKQEQSVSHTQSTPALSVHGTSSMNTAAQTAISQQVAANATSSGTATSAPGSAPTQEGISGEATATTSSATVSSDPSGYTPSAGASSISTANSLTVSTNTPMSTQSVGPAITADAQIAELKFIGQVLVSLRSDMRGYFSGDTAASTATEVATPAAPSKSASTKEITDAIVKAFGPTSPILQVLKSLVTAGGAGANRSAGSSPQTVANVELHSPINNRKSTNYATSYI